MIIIISIIIIIIISLICFLGLPVSKQASMEIQAFLVDVFLLLCTN